MSTKQLNAYIWIYQAIIRFMLLNYLKNIYQWSSILLFDQRETEIW